MKEKLQDALGGIGAILYFVITAFLAVYPIGYLDMPLWVMLVAVAVVTFLPLIGSIAMIVIWVLGFIQAVSGPQTMWEILFYILFVVQVIKFVSAFVGTKQK